MKNIWLCAIGALLFTGCNSDDRVITPDKQTQTTQKLHFALKIHSNNLIDRIHSYMIRKAANPQSNPLLNSYITLTYQPDIEGLKDDDMRFAKDVKLSVDENGISQALELSTGSYFISAFKVMNKGTDLKELTEDDYPSFEADELPINFTVEPEMSNPYIPVGVVPISDFASGYTTAAEESKSVEISISGFTSRWLVIHLQVQELLRRKGRLYR